MQRSRSSATSRRGVTLLELMIVVVMIGIMTAVIVPRMRVSQGSRVRSAAAQLSNDLELVRSRGLQTRRPMRVVFDDVTETYSAFLANEGAAAPAETEGERDSVRVFRGRVLPEGIEFGRGSAAILPGQSGDAISFAAGRLNFSSRGMPHPLGTRGVVYLRSTENPAFVSAVVTSGAGAFRLWTWNGAVWK